MEIQPTDMVSWYRCTDAFWHEKEFNDKEGRPIKRDYLRIELDGRYPLDIPHSTKTQSAWAAFVKVFEEKTGQELNGNPQDLLKNKHLALKKHKITYYDQFEDDRWLVVATQTDAQKKSDKPATQFNKELDEDVCVTVLSLQKRLGEPVDFFDIKDHLDIKNIPDEEIEASIIRVMAEGRIYSPSTGMYKSVDG